MTREQMEKIAASAASEWCRCFKCDGIINETGDRCDKKNNVTCLKYRDGYKTALIALEKAERQGVDIIEHEVRLHPVVASNAGPTTFSIEVELSPSEIIRLAMSKTIKLMIK